MILRLTLIAAALLLTGCYTVGGDRMDRQSLSPQEVRERIETYQREEAGGQDWLIITQVRGGQTGVIDTVLTELKYTDTQLCGIRTQWRRPRGGVEWRNYGSTGSPGCFDYADIDAVRHERRTAADNANGVAGTGLILVMSPFLLPFYIIGLGGASGG